MPIEFIIEFSSALHQGSGYGIGGVVDRALLRDAEGMPYIPGSAVKGKMREAALRVLRLTGRNRCGAPGQEFCKDEQGC